MANIGSAFLGDLQAQRIRQLASPTSSPPSSPPPANAVVEVHCLVQATRQLLTQSSQVDFPSSPPTTQPALSSAPASASSLASIDDAPLCKAAAKAESMSSLCFRDGSIDREVLILFRSSSSPLTRLAARRIPRPDETRGRRRHLLVCGALTA